MEYYVPLAHNYVGVVEAADVLGVHWETAKCLSCEVVFEQRESTIR
jgi:hypothetical protein